MTPLLSGAVSSMVVETTCVSPGLAVVKAPCSQFAALFISSEVTTKGGVKSWVVVQTKKLAAFLGKNNPPAPLTIMAMARRDPKSWMQLRHSVC